MNLSMRHLVSYTVILLLVVHSFFMKNGKQQPESFVEPRSSLIVVDSSDTMMNTSTLRPPRNPLPSSSSLIISCSNASSAGNTSEEHSEPFLMRVKKGQSMNFSETKTVEVKHLDSKLPVKPLPTQHQPKSTSIGGEKSEIHVLIAKTIGHADINDTLLDIEELSFRQSNISVHWKIFCFENSTYDVVYKTLSHRTDVACHVAEGRPKTYFWKEFLDPATMLAPEIDYLMMVDGDTPLRFMGWACFWDLVHVQLKPAMFMPAVMVDHPSQETALRYAGKAHFEKCETNPRRDGRIQNNNFQRLQAVETNMVDLQVPGFRRDAWEIVYSNFEKKIPSWGGHVSDYGPDAVWCGLVESVLNGGILRDKSLFAQNWLNVQETCHVNTSYPTSHSADNLICAIIHETPVYHRDTKALSSAKNRRATNWWSTATGELKLYLKAFPDVMVNKHNKGEHNREYFRSFFDDRASSCQSCRTASCTKRL
mmetsp:Transcript_3508/g.5866  ORF Transcript_3508/g.5866 Transcript_3508/m.5866 type:complete len:480 (+) Transcript_3508:60-1499(+)